MSTQETYDPGYYDALVEGSLRSARAVLPHVLEAVRPRSVLDVGCGTGAWASVCAELGVEDVLGVDGDYVDRGRLLLPAERFVAADLEGPVDLGRRFDLGVSLEVGEHLAPWAAARYVGTLTRHADVVLFSAAIPGQGGQHHVNEQWPEYWAQHFAEHGYRPCDLLRPRVWHDPAVETWYAQNLLVFVREDRAADFPMLAQALRPLGAPLAAVHPRLYDTFRPWRGQPGCADPGAPRAVAPPADPDDLDVVVRSPGRPAQLERGLRSARLHARAWTTAHWTVLLEAEDEATRAAYALVRDAHPELSWVDLGRRPGAPAVDQARLGERAWVAVVDGDHVWDAHPDGPELPALPREDAIPLLRRAGFAALALGGAERAPDLEGAARLVAGERLRLDGTGWEWPAAARGALVTVAYVDELLERPGLLRAYAAAVTPDADATLVLYAPDQEPEAVAPALEALLASAELDGPGGPDLELLGVPGEVGDPALAAAAAAVLSARAPRAGLAALVHLDEGGAELLRDAASAGRAACEGPAAPALGPPGPVHAAGVRAGHLLELVRAGGHRALVGSGGAWAALVARLPAGADHAEVVAPGQAARELPVLAAEAGDAPLVWVGGPGEQPLAVLEALAAARLPAGTTVVVDGLHRFGAEAGEPSLLGLLAVADRLFPGARTRSGPDCITLVL